MRHRVYGKHLGRNKDERDNLFKGLTQALFTHGTIQTSKSRAKAITGLVDKIINLARDKQSSRLQSFLTDKDIRERLISEIVPKLGAKSSGFTRIVAVGTRVGDQTEMVRMTLIGAEELKPLEKELRIKNPDKVEDARQNRRQESSKKVDESKKKISASTKKAIKTKVAQPKKGGKKA